jgi:hypothetical protein
MSEIEYEYPEFVVKLALEFKAIKVVGSKLVPTTWKLNAEVLYEDSDEEDKQGDLEIKIGIAKIRYWLTNYVNNCVMFDVGNEWAMRAIFNADDQCDITNNIMMLPWDPQDDLIAEILHSKFNALAGPYLQFGIIELSSDDDLGLSYMFTGDGEGNLPEVSEWIGDHTFYDKPWWARDDGSTFDLMPNPDADLEIKPFDTLKMDHIRASMTRMMGVEATVIRPNFKPTVLDGGKNE